MVMTILCLMLNILKVGDVNFDIKYRVIIAIS